MYYNMRASGRSGGIVVDNAYLLVDARELRSLAVRRLILRGYVVGHPYNVAAAHGADLSLHEPLAQARLMEYVRAIRHLLQRLALLELLQAYRAVHVLESVLVVSDRLKQAHVGLGDLFPKVSVHILEALPPHSVLSVLIDEQAEHDKEHDHEEARDRDRYPD